MPCQLCDRPVVDLTEHHLVPRQYTRRRHLPTSQTVLLCRPCHRQIHTLFDNATLAKDLNTLEQLQAEPRLQKFVAWVRKQQPHKRVRSCR
ncbi:HNH endonuclease [Nodosilinea sp. PGN35]|uniref:HNH endonuclease n=1 Tax=Nodosilinea sp. PGN35 TaxID=3020489 RepID=UPI0023B2F7E7|nr:HNH endonuclease [Nodosilinea sp. TSF1-S3]MDF0370053.1 HNH endonuclease [Nodosilinea sp. TSF1-S3]